LRFLQASRLLPLHRTAPVSTRAIPVRFEEVSRVKRPGQKASEERKKQYRAAVQQQHLSQRLVARGEPLRRELDRAGGENQILVWAGGGSFSNRTCFRQSPERPVLLVRARQNAKLCFRAPAGSRRFYAEEKFTPEPVRQDEAHAWKTTQIFYGGKRRKVRCQTIATRYWQGGARRRPLRLLVMAPTPYRKSKNKKLYYRDPAYPLTTELHSSPKQLLQIYFGRWQIEVNHREEKDTLGVGQAQWWNPISVPKQPVLAVAAYSALLLASLQTFGPERGALYAQLPKGRRHARSLPASIGSPYCEKEMAEQPHLLAPFGFQITDKALVQAATA
jgi:hypothetical protein